MPRLADGRVERQPSPRRRCSRRAAPPVRPRQSFRDGRRVVDDRPGHLLDPVAVPALHGERAVVRLRTGLRGDETACIGTSTRRRRAARSSSRGRRPARSRAQRGTELLARVHGEEERLVVAAHERVAEAVHAGELRASASAASRTSRSALLPPVAMICGPSPMTRPMPKPAEQPGSFERGTTDWSRSSVRWCSRAQARPTTCMYMWQFAVERAACRLARTVDPRQLGRRVARAVDVLRSRSRS